MGITAGTHRKNHVFAGKTQRFPVDFQWKNPLVNIYFSEHYLYYSSAPPILRVEPLAGRHAEQREAADPNSANRWVVFYSLAGLAQYIWYNSVH